MRDRFPKLSTKRQRDVNAKLERTQSPWQEHLRAGTRSGDHGRTFTEASSESASMTMTVERREGSSSSTSMRVALQKMPRSLAAPLLRTGCTAWMQRHGQEGGGRGGWLFQHACMQEITLVHVIAAAAVATRSLTLTLAHSRFLSLTHSLTYSLTYSLPHSLTYSLTPSLTDSPMHR